MFGFLPPALALSCPDGRDLQQTPDNYLVLGFDKSIVPSRGLPAECGR
jgi:hypothetical protein